MSGERSQGLTQILGSCHFPRLTLNGSPHTLGLSPLALLFTVGGDSPGVLRILRPHLALSAWLALLYRPGTAGSHRGQLCHAGSPGDT